MRMLLCLIAVAIARLGDAECACNDCMAMHPAVLGRSGDTNVCVGAKDTCDASCSKCVASEGKCAAEPSHTSLMQTSAEMGCPPPQPCTCNCNCQELVYPVPPPMPMLPTPSPYFSLVQGVRSSGEVTSKTVVSKPEAVWTNAERATISFPMPRSLLSTLTTLTRRQSSTSKQPVPGVALPAPGAPINLLPPPPMPPLPPMPKDPRVQECPVNTPCTCYCHCKQPDDVPAAQLFVPPTYTPPVSVTAAATSV